MNSHRWQVFKNVVVFQIKLAMDAVRDLLLSPVSIFCALIDIIKDHPTEKSYYQKLMKLGHQSDRWLNLFAFRDSASEEKVKSSQWKKGVSNTAESQENQEANVDKLFDKIEQVLEQQLANGNTKANARELLDKHLAKLSYLNKQKIPETSKPPE